MNDENAIHFSGYNDLITRKRVTFWVFIFNEWWKRVSFSGYNDQIIRKRVTFWIFIFDEWWKRGSFFGYNDLIIRKRITFFGYIDLGIYKSVALPPCPYLLFLSWYKKRRQKKIKASAEAGEVDRIHDWSWERITFWGHNDRINWKRTFYGLHRWCKSQKVVFEVCTAGASISKVAFGRYSMLSKTFYRDKGPHSFVLHIE